VLDKHVYLRDVVTGQSPVIIIGALKWPVCRSF